MRISLVQPCAVYLASLRTGNYMCSQKIVDNLLDLAHVKHGFEQVLLAYREHRWDDLLTLLASQPQTVISTTLKERGAQYIIDTGEIPNVWQYQHAMPVSDHKFHVYALMANHTRRRYVYAPVRFRARKKH